MNWIDVAVRGVAVSALIAVAGTAQADPFSITGRYEGLYACDSSTAGVPSSWARPMSAAIVQDGTTIRIDLRYTDEAEEGAEYSLYTGELAAAPDGSFVTGYFAACGGTFPSLELARIFPAATNETAFQFAVDSVWASDEVPNIPGLTVQSCKWSLRRVSTDTPTVRPCTTPPG